MRLNIDKCKVLSIARNKKSINYKYSFITSDNKVLELEHVSSMSDLGIIIDCELKFKEHIYHKINKAYQMLGIISRNFIDLDKASFIVLYKSLVRSQLEYGNSVWNPYKCYLIEDIEKVQKRATKLVKGLRKVPYNERLIRLGLPTLKYRRVRGDMINVFKILKGFYDKRVSPLLVMSDFHKTRGNSLKLLTERSKYDLRKYSFTSRIVNVWNSLPDTVICALSLNSFKNRLDKCWKNEEVYFNYKAELTNR
jgi:hypothetical protein